MAKEAVTIVFFINGPFHKQTLKLAIYDSYNLTKKTAFK